MGSLGTYESISLSAVNIPKINNLQKEKDKMKYIYFLIPFVVIGIFFWGCIEDSPISVDQYNLDDPDSNLAITESYYTDGTDFSEGYYNGKIRTDQVTLEWEASEDENFLAYKIFRGLGVKPPDSSISIHFSEGFDSGSFPNGWNVFGSNGNESWYVTNEYSKEDPHSLMSHPNYYLDNYLQKTLTVPQNSEIFISYFSKGMNDGDGFFHINGYTYNQWGYDFHGPNWTYNSMLYNTGSNTEITLQWTYNSEYYGYGLLDNIEVNGGESGEFSYSLIETLNNQNSTTVTDTALTQNQYYTYKVVNIIKTGTHRVDDIAIKTPLWKAPDIVIANGLSSTVVELNWKDSTESEAAFRIYIDTLDVNLGNYAMVDSTTAGQDDTTKVIFGLSESAQYRFSIKATNNWEDDTPLSYSSSFTFQFDAPSNLSANQKELSKLVDLTWYDNSSMENGFIIYRDTDTGAGFELLATVDANSTSYTDTDITDFEYDGTYTYRVKAYNNYSGTVYTYTDYSNESSVTLELSSLFEGFEDGILPEGWSTSTSSDSGWSISSNYVFNGNYSIHCGGGFNDMEYLEVTMDVPLYTTIDISFYQYEFDDSIDGDLYINNSYNFDWDSSGGGWHLKSTTYNTGWKNQITLQWRYTTASYGDIYLDNIQVSW